jgi:RHS repeat-associated protein
LYYLNARMYDPKTARFIQEDTYDGNPNDPLSLNLYTYCANNPLIYWDPTGHSLWALNTLLDKAIGTMKYD